MTTIIYHNADLDGKASAAVVKSKFPDAELVGINYNEEIDLEQFRGQTVIMVDISLPAKDMVTLDAIAEKFIWIDHHSSAIKEMESIFKGIQEVGRAACELAWQFCFPDKPIPLGIWLLGRYDVWDHHDPRVLPFQYGARMVLDDVDSHKWAQLLENNKDVLDEIANAGNILYGYIIQEHSNYVAHHATEVCLPAKHKMLECMAINRGAFSTPVLDKFLEDYDAVLSFAMLPTGKWGFRISSIKYNCGEIAKEFGGGGHMGVAGFVVDSIPFQFEHEAVIPERTHLQPKLHFNHETENRIEWDGFAIKKAIPIQFKTVDEPFSVATMEGVLYGKAGDKLMKGIKGELYPCDKEIFENSYDVLDEKNTGLAKTFKNAILSACVEMFKSKKEAFNVSVYISDNTCVAGVTLLKYGNLSIDKKATFTDENKIDVIKTCVNNLIQDIADFYFRNKTHVEEESRFENNLVEEGRKAIADRKDISVDEELSAKQKLESKLPAGLKGTASTSAGQVSGKASASQSKYAPLTAKEELEEDEPRAQKQENKKAGKSSGKKTTKGK